MSWHLFEVVGLELEYMIVDATTLDVRPIADALLREAHGGSEADVTSDVERGTMAWSNELAMHVIELKTNGPATSFAGLGETFHGEVKVINDLLRSMGARLMPTAMHPWMNPDNEMRLWPHENTEIYRAFDRIFDCRGHGWANLQSTHINLPFLGDEEFGRLHAAIRVALPILSGLTASSPFAEGRHHGFTDYRLEVYRHNADRIPSVAGQVIPEAFFTEASYRRGILERIYHDLAPQDPEGVLRNEWANARGAIARFSRGSIEIRTLDIQECPQADMAIAEAIVALVRELATRPEADLRVLQAWDTGQLAAHFLGCVHEGGRYVLRDAAYLDALGLEASSMSVDDVWRRLAARLNLDTGGPLGVVLEHGCLTHRIERAVGVSPDAPRLKDVYLRLCECLEAGTSFIP